MREQKKGGVRKKKKETRDRKQVLPWGKWEGVMRKGTVENHELLDQQLESSHPTPRHLPRFTVTLMRVRLDLDVESSYEETPYTRRRLFPLVGSRVTC